MTFSSSSRQVLFALFVCVAGVHVISGLSLIPESTPPPLCEHEGEEVQTENKCEFCYCGLVDGHLDIICHTMLCDIPECHGFWESDDSTCCGGTCRCDVDGNLYDYGDNVPNTDPCTSCTCAEFGKLICATMDCARLPCPPGTLWVSDGTCCGGSCTSIPGCQDNGKVYAFGEVIPKKDPCMSCHCGEFGEEMCLMMACQHCEGEWENDGTCCGTCKCKDNGRLYDVGQEVPSKDPCKINCVCQQDGTVICAMLRCLPPVCPDGTLFEGDGTCCGGTCVGKSGCEDKGRFYKVGESMPGDDPCMKCTCMADGTKGECRSMSCLDEKELPCSKKLRYKNNTMCCHGCKCKVKKNTYLPGEQVGHKCDGCVCENGKVSCNPPICPQHVLECVDPVLGDDCCYHCPNGRTCFLDKNTIIQQGEIKLLKNKYYCMCVENPWYPYAFCAPKNLKKNLINKKYENYIADYKIAVDN